MKIYALVIIYNKRCEDSSSIKAIQKYGKGIQVVVFDNSERKLDNNDYCIQYGYQYISQGENVGLSKAYNCAINHIIHEDDDYLITLDDDTELTKEYFEELEILCGENRYDVILPVIRSSGIILSPSNLVNGCHSRTVNDIAELNQETITAINSGAVIRMGLYKKIQYNEALFLDYVDHDFMKKAHRNNAKFKVMRSTIKQHYSRHEKMSIENAVKRFKVETSDLKTFCAEAGKLGFYRMYMIKLIAQLTAKYHSPIFIKTAISRKETC